MKQDISRNIRHVRPDALMVTTKEGSSYTDILRTMKSDDLQIIGDSVFGGCGQTASDIGQKSSRKDGKIRTAIAEKMAGKAEVMCKIDSVASELKDLDELTDAEEVFKALHNQIDSAEKSDISAVKSLCMACGGTHTAVVVLPLELARKAIDKGSIRVGGISSRVREKMSPQ